VCALLTDEHRAAALSVDALRHVQEYCSWNAVAQCFLAQCPRRAAAGEPSYAGQAA